LWGFIWRWLVWCLFSHSAGCLHNTLFDCFHGCRDVLIYMVCKSVHHHTFK
jgi:hypothetical protein